MTVFLLGVRGSHLRMWNHTQHEFLAAHTALLVYFIALQKISTYIQSLLAEMNALNIDQADALLELYGFGLRFDHLKRWPTHGVSFRSGHKDALYHVMTDAKNPLSAVDAMSEIAALNDAQAFALGQLYQYGLRGDHLRNCKVPFGFDIAHADALYVLMTGTYLPHSGAYGRTGLFFEERRTLISSHFTPFTPEAAISEITGLSVYQARVLATGKPRGLRRDDLLSFREGSRAGLQNPWDMLFSDAHVDALEMLMHKIQPSLIKAQAIVEINELCGSQASTLEKLYVHGLRGDHFRTLWKGDFTHWHGEALERLITGDNKLAIAQAMAEISELSDAQAIAISELYANGLRKMQLLHWNDETPAFTFAHSSAIKTLMTTPEMERTLEQALVAVKGLSEEQARVLKDGYVYGLTPEDLKAWVSNGNTFGQQHGKALNYLMMIKGLPGSEAVSMITGLNNEQARALSSKIRQAVKPTLANLFGRGVSDSSDDDEQFERHQTPTSPCYGAGL